MEHIDKKIQEQIQELEKLQQLKTELQQKQPIQEDNNVFNLIQKQVDDYIMYKTLETQIKPTRGSEIAYNDPIKWRQMNEQYKSMTQHRQKNPNQICSNDYQLLMSQAILELYKNK